MVVRVQVVKSSSSVPVCASVIKRILTVSESGNHTAETGKLTLKMMTKTNTRISKT